RWTNPLTLASRVEVPPAIQQRLIAEADTTSKNGKLSAASERIAEGNRNDALASLGGVMRRRGLSQAAIHAALREHNAEQCDPPLADAEAARTAQSVARYEPDKLAGVTIVTAGVPPAAELATTSLTEVKPAPVRWLVPDYLPLGKLVMTAGDGGHGKSSLSLH